jgi:hypothetical protein
MQVAIPPSPLQIPDISTALNHKYNHRLHTLILCI